MSKSPEQLTCISIILCDDVYRDELTKKQVIVGTFNRVSARELPAIHPKMCVLFSLTDGNGEYDLSVAVEHEKTGQEILRVAGPLKVDDPQQIVDIDLNLQGVVFPEEGKYWIVLRSDDRILQQRPFFVRVIGGSDDQTE